MTNQLQEGDRVIDDYEQTWTVIAIKDDKVWLEEEIIDRHHKTIALNSLRFYKQAEESTAPAGLKTVHTSLRTLKSN